MRIDRVVFMLAGLMLAGAVARPGAQTPANPQDLFLDDVHAKAGLSCISCHAGAPPYAPIERMRIAQLCARCHADAHGYAFVRGPASATGSRSRSATVGR